MARGAALVPNVNALLEPTLAAIQAKGGSATNDEIQEAVIRSLRLPDEAVEASHLGSTTQTELEYRLAWARTTLKGAGYLDRGGRGIWVLTEKGRSARKLDAAVIRGMSRARRSSSKPDESPPADSKLPSRWQEELVGVLLKLEPSAFERLCQRVLRESGFDEVEVTGRTGDGGIDGRGIVRLGGLLTFPVVFQCKRYSGSVGSKYVRDFRGAMAGRADRGLFLTTGRFSHDAKAEARRDGVPPIDLVDGEALAERIASLGLGVVKHESFSVDEAWFADI